MNAIDEDRKEHNIANAAYISKQYYLGAAAESVHQ